MDPADPADDESDDDQDWPIAVASTLVLGLGLLTLFLGYSWFWIVFALGFAVVVPLVSILNDRFGPGSESSNRSRPAADRDREPAEDALETLKERYARGEIGDAEFERRLEKLVENESIEDVEGRLGGQDDDFDLEYGFEFDSEVDRELEREREQ